MSTATLATAYVRRMVKNEISESGVKKGALDRVCEAFRLDYWPMEHIRRGNAKRIETGTFERIRMAYIRSCERQAERLLNEAARAKRVGDYNDEIAAIADKAKVLLAELEAETGYR